LADFADVTRRNVAYFIAADDVDATIRGMMPYATRRLRDCRATVPPVASCCLYKDAARLRVITSAMRKYFTLFTPACLHLYVDLATSFKIPSPCL